MCARSDSDRHAISGGGLSCRWVYLFSPRARGIAPFLSGWRGINQDRFLPGRSNIRFPRSRHGANRTLKQRGLKPPDMPILLRGEDIFKSTHGESRTRMYLRTSRSERDGSTKCPTWAKAKDARQGLLSVTLDGTSVRRLSQYRGRESNPHAFTDARF